MKCEMTLPKKTGFSKALWDSELFLAWNLLICGIASRKNLVF